MKNYAAITKAVRAAQVTKENVAEHIDAVSGISVEHFNKVPNKDSGRDWCWYTPKDGIAKAAVRDPLAGTDLTLMFMPMSRPDVVSIGTSGAQITMRSEYVAVDEGDWIVEDAPTEWYDVFTNRDFWQRYVEVGEQPEKSRDTSVLQQVANIVNDPHLDMALKYELIQDLIGAS